MAWNNNSGGPWGGGGGNSGGPWGGGGNRGGGGGPFGSRRPPDMEDVIRRGQERLKNLIPGGFGSYKGIVLVVLAAMVIWLVTGFFRVQPNQQAIQLVFGKPYGKPVEPGLHYNLRNRLAATLDYRFSTVQTNYTYMVNGFSDDPSFVRHELLLGMRFAM